MAELKVVNGNLVIEIRRGDELIVRWIIDDKGNLIDEQGKLPCPICGSDMKPHYLIGVHHPYKGNAFDFNVKCVNPSCSFFATFGNPISPELVDDLRKFGGKWVNWWDFEGDVEVIERLQSWGYW